MKDKLKNVKGFTLIELLAVIVILGILLMTAIPAVTKNIAKSRRNTYWQNAKSYVKAAATPYLAGEYYKRTNDSSNVEVCPLPGPNQYVAIPLLAVELEQGDKNKSSFNSPYQEVDDKCQPMIIVLNKGTVEKDDLQWYFMGMDKANNGINKFININNLNIKSVVTNGSCGFSVKANTSPAPYVTINSNDQLELSTTCASNCYARAAVCTNQSDGSPAK